MSLLSGVNLAGRLARLALLSCLGVLVLAVPAHAKPVLTPYDCWGHLGFEAATLGSISHWSANGSAVSFISDAGQAYAGAGALRIDGTAPVSVWGGRVGGTRLPQAGDLVGGTFWIKLLSAPTGTLDVRMTSYDSNQVETVYCNVNSADLSALPLNTWVQVNITSNGKAVIEGQSIGFNIVSGGGVDCLIDVVVFGDVTDDDMPGGVDVLAVSPHVSEYVGSTFNGNFEVGNLAVGLQYWGQYVPVAGDTSMLTLVVPETVAGTAPGAAKSGSNMVAVGRGGVAWNIGNLASVGTERLPRAGDRIGGSYWLYVPEDADLSAAVPSVYVVYQSASGGDVTIAQASGIPNESLTKGSWNHIPIWPDAGMTVADGARGLAIMITAPQLNASNPLYPSKYYIDDIRIGAIPAGIYFLAATGLTDATGVPVVSLESDASILYARAVLQNSEQSEPVEGKLVLRLYEGALQKQELRYAVTLPAKGASGVATEAFAIEAALDGLDVSRLNARLYFYTADSEPNPLASYALVQQVRTVLADDPAIAYLGRWDREGSISHGDWIRPVFKVNFSGSTSVAINLLEATGLTVFLDGVQTDYSTVNGVVRLGENLDPTRAHTLEVAPLTWTDTLRFDALLLDDTGVPHTPAVSRDVIEFIGDSITVWDNGYAWRVPRMLGVEGVRVAWPGIALLDNFGYYTLASGYYSRIGMQSAFFDKGMQGYGTAGDWDFAAAPYTPTVVVINLGTNDAEGIRYVPGFVTNFENAYRQLIQDVRARYPQAEIFVIRPFTIAADNVQAAIANAVATSGVSRVHYIDTTGWGIDIVSDGIHPSDAGHIAIANRLSPLIAPYLQGGVRESAPQITSNASAVFAPGSDGFHAVAAAGYPAPTYSAIDLPPWANLDAQTGVLTGTPPQEGTYRFTLVASNSVGSPAEQDFTLHVAVPNARILFVGNSFTYGHEEPVLSYNRTAITDADNSGFGGVPGIFKKFTQQAGLDYAVTIEAAGGMGLDFHLNQKAGIIGGSGWDVVVLQEQSIKPLPAARGGNPAAFMQSADQLSDLAHRVNPQARVLLYESWASPASVVGQGYASRSSAAGLHAMQDDLTAAFFHAYYRSMRSAEADADYAGVARVGEAFMRAIDLGYADPDMTDGIGSGQFYLWNTGDHRHAGVAGSYLSAAVMFAEITGLDPRSIDTGPESAAAALGLSAVHAQQLHAVAYEIQSAVYPTPPVPVAGLVATATADGILLEWVSDSFSDGVFIVERAIAGSNVFAEVAELPASSRSYLEHTAVSGVFYEYRVVAVNGIGTSASVPVSALRPTPLQAWRIANALPADGSGIGADDAQPDADGIPNLLKYATGTPVGLPSVAGPAKVFWGDEDYLGIVFNRLDPAPVDYYVEASENLVDWNTIAHLPAQSSAWQGSAGVAESAVGTMRLVTVYDTVAVESVAQRFLRLRVGEGIVGTIPEGAVTWRLSAGSITAVSLPLQATPVARGTVTQVFADGVNVTTEAWPDSGELHMLRFLSGGASGVALAVNEAADGVISLETEGIYLPDIVTQGDRFIVYPATTLASLLGADAAELKRAATISTADSIQVLRDGIWLGFYHNGNTWRQAGSLRSQNNTVVGGDEGMLFTRRADTALNVSFLGRVHEVAPRAKTYVGGAAFVAGFHPVPYALGQTGFATAENWQHGAVSSEADLVQIFNAGSWLGFYHNGANWRQVGALQAAGSRVLDPVQPLLIIRRGSPAEAPEFIEQPLPYEP